MPPASFSRENPPQSICLLRTSAIGDVTHVVPLVRTLQSAWPQTRLTWIVGKLEHKLVGDIAGVEFLIFDKSVGWRGFRNLRTQLAALRRLMKITPANTVVLRRQLSEAAVAKGAYLFY